MTKEISRTMNHNKQCYSKVGCGANDRCRVENNTLNVESTQIDLSNVIELNIKLVSIAELKVEIMIIIVKCGTNMCIKDKDRVDCFREPNNQLINLY